MLFCLGFAAAHVNALAGWRFCVLSFLGCTLLAFTVEMTAAVADGAHVLTKTVVMRWLRHLPSNGEENPSAADSNNPETPS